MNGRLNYIIEIPLFFMLLAATLTGSLFTNLISYQTCYVTLNYTQDICSELGKRNSSPILDKLETEVQHYTTVIQMVITITETFLPALLGLFLGPWSDRHGRKPVILLCLFGLLIRASLVTLLILLPYLSPWVYVLASIPISFTGGVALLIGSIFCYISDIVPEDKRTLRMVYLSSTVSGGSIAGQIVSAYVYNGGNYLLLYCVSTICYLFAFIYIMLIISESILEIYQPEGISGVFNVELIRDMFKVFMKKRENNKRGFIWICLIILGILTFVMYGTISIDYFFVRKELDWTLKFYNDYSSISSLVNLVGTLIGIYILNRLLRIDELTLLLFALILHVLIFTSRIFVTQTIHMFYILPLAAFLGIAGPMTRSLISYTVPNTELGKIFSVAACTESLLPMIATTAYTYVYNITLETLPSAFNIISVALCSIATCILLYSYYCLPRVRPNQQHQQLLTDEDEPVIN